MNVSRLEVVKRGLVGRCPNCGHPTLFRGKFGLRVNSSCPECGLRFEKVEGEFLGPLVINYGVTVFALVVPTILLYAAGVLSGRLTAALAIVIAFGAPVLLYRMSWSWWLMFYYFFLPENLPANLGGAEETDL